MRAFAFPVDQSWLCFLLGGGEWVLENIYHEEGRTIFFMQNTSKDAVLCNYALSGDPKTSASDSFYNFGAI